MTSTSYSRMVMAGALMGSVLLWPLQSSAEMSDQATTPTPEGTGLLMFSGNTLSLEALDGCRGGTEVHVANDNKVDGTLYGGQAYNLTTGMNSINEGSFAGASGVATVIQNSGNNVLIQNSTIVNLQVQ